MKLKMKVNWKVRLKNKVFWVTAIPMVLLLLKQLLGLFGIDFDTTELQASLISIVGTVFGLLALLGIVVDPTTEGLCDSCDAMNYEAPKVKKEDE